MGTGFSVRPVSLIYKNKAAADPVCGGFSFKSLVDLQLDAETRHDSGSADVMAGSRTGEGDALENLGARVTRELRGQTTANLGPGCAGIDIEVLVQGVVGQERDLIIGAGAGVRTRAT